MGDPQPFSTILHHLGDKTVILAKAGIHISMRWKAGFPLRENDGNRDNKSRRWKSRPLIFGL
jgi:hypothetical protein